MSQKIPAYLKEAVKYVISAGERKKIQNQISIRKLQDRAIRDFDQHSKKLIVFLVPGTDRQTGTDKISGGVISIVSLCEESTSLKSIHGAEVIMCTLPNELVLFRHTQFKNDTNVFRFSQLRQYFGSLSEVIIHIPEFTCGYFLEHLSEQDKDWLAAIPYLQINILNQNIRLMPGDEIIGKIKALADKVTCTTAHQRYCTEEYRRKFGVPLHKLSVWISPEKYHFVQFAEKENLIIISPDPHPSRDEVIEKLRKIKGLTAQVIQNLTYEEYKATIGRAKWALTFGEGLDGYIIEPIFSGSVAFAVYNEDFFTPDFKELETIYDSYDQLLDNIESDIQKLDNESSFQTYQQLEFARCSWHYSEQVYKNNLAAYYKNEYTFP